MVRIEVGHHHPAQVGHAGPPAGLPQAQIEGHLVEPVAGSDVGQPPVVTQGSEGGPEGHPESFDQQPAPVGGGGRGFVDRCQVHRVGRQLTVDDRTELPTRYAVFGTEVDAFEDGVDEGAESASGGQAGQGAGRIGRRGGDGTPSAVRSPSSDPSRSPDRSSEAPASPSDGS